MKHHGTPERPIPASGVGPRARLTTDSRGFFREGVVHAIPEEFENTSDRDNTVTTLCGRTLFPMSVYEQDAWPRMAEQYERIGRTHVTHICGNCARKWSGGR